MSIKLSECVPVKPALTRYKEGLIRMLNVKHKLLSGAAAAVTLPGAVLAQEAPALVPLTSNISGAARTAGSDLRQIE